MAEIRRGRLTTSIVIHPPGTKRAGERQTHGRARGRSAWITRSPCKSLVSLHLFLAHVSTPAFRFVCATMSILYTLAVNHARARLHWPLFVYPQCLCAGRSYDMPRNSNARIDQMLCASHRFFCNPYMRFSSED